MQTDQQFLASLYAGLLGRAPDPAGLTYWSTTLAQGATRGSVAAGFAITVEAKTFNAPHTNAPSAQVFARDMSGTVLHELFETGLGREVDLPSLAAFQQGLAAGVTPLQVAQTIVGSSEFLGVAANANDPSYVGRLYAAGLGRGPTQADLDYWVGGLSNGTMTQASVLLGVGTSPEAGSHLTRAF